MYIRFLILFHFSTRHKIDSVENMLANELYAQFHNLSNVSPPWVVGLRMSTRVWPSQAFTGTPSTRAASIINMNVHVRLENQISQNLIKGSIGGNKLLICTKQLVHGPISLGTFPASRKVHL